MNADPGQGRRGVRDNITIADDGEPRNSCPLACLAAASVLYDQRGREAATLCTVCDSAISRTEWLALLAGGLA